ncbi:unnamed protein product [Brassica rapa]|uniref:Uncharacterized protein n=1 Tax=Brassica campestris TaxID=3711 RepID=A0A3P5YS79_BRACM|nr:unnamed protein product [Brassica rapa]VDC70627.1 unnamed protein product [Brassica rapa]
MQLVILYQRGKNRAQALLTVTLGRLGLMETRIVVLLG